MWKKGWKRKHDASGGAGGSDDDHHGGAGGSKKPAGSRSDSNDDNDITVCEIAKNRRVSVRSWQGKIVVDIREFYMKDGKQLPGKKGISLPMDQIIRQLSYLINKLKIKQMFQPPIMASLLAIVIGVTPFLKKMVLTDDAPLFFLTDSFLILGGAMIPCILLALGGNLVDGPGAGSAKLGFRTTAAIIFGRLILVPPAGLGIVTLADKLGFLPPGDKMFKFVLLLQHSMPTSVLSGAVANLRGYGKESAAILFWVHVFSVFSMAGWIIVYLSLLF